MNTQVTSSQPLLEPIEEFARKTGTEIPTARAMARDGRIASVKTSPGKGGRVLVPVTEAPRFLRQAEENRRRTIGASPSQDPDDGTTVVYNDEWSRAEDGDEFLDADGFPLSGEALAEAKAALRAERAADAAKHREELKALQASRDRQAAADTALRDQRQKKLNWLADPNGGLAVLDALDPFTIADTLRAARKAAAEQAAAQAVIDAADAEEVE
ncbi:hypothetical protein GCM10028801_36180 [Nocardioides maradonensis]